MMQVTESYLMSRLAPGLGAWLARLKADADRELCRALRLLQYHTQVGSAYVVGFGRCCFLYFVLRFGVTDGGR